MSNVEKRSVNFTDPLSRELQINDELPLVASHLQQARPMLLSSLIPYFILTAFHTLSTVFSIPAICSNIFTPAFTIPAF